MASLVEILIAAQDRSAPAFQSAARNVSGLGAASDATSVRIDSMSDRLQLQHRQLALLERQLAETTAAHGAGSIAVERQQIAYDRLALSVRTTERELDRLHDEQRRAGPVVGGAAVPPGLGGLTGERVLGGLAGLGVGLGVSEVAGQLRELARQGLDTQAALDSTRASLAHLLDDQNRANQVFADAAAFGEQYRFTQRDIAEALRASSLLIRDSTASTEALLSVLGRLSALNPAEGLEGAAVALRELASGDTVSLRERFNIAAKAANAMNAEIKAGADAVLVLGRYLDQEGITNGLLASQLEGAAGQQRAWNAAIEGLGLAVNDVVTSTGWRTFSSGLIRDTTREIQWLGDLTASLAAFGTNLENSPLMRTINRLDDFVQGRAFQGVLEAGRMVGLVRPEAGASGFGAAAPPPTAAAAAPAAAPTASAPAPGPPIPAPNAASQAPITVIVQGSVVTERQLVDAVQAGLLEKQRQNGTTGFR